jgi:hypothetical protein
MAPYYVPSVWMVLAANKDSLPKQHHVSSVLPLGVYGNEHLWVMATSHCTRLSL